MTAVPEAGSQFQTMIGKTALITGSSRGIGAGIAIELSNRGANIVLNYPVPSLRDECEAVGRQLKTEWIAICADLTHPSGPSDLVSAGVQRFGHIDILVSNAGIVPLGHIWEEDSLLPFDKTIALNVRGAFEIVKAALPHLTPYKLSEPASSSGVLGGSRIVIVGSVASRIPKAMQAVYAASKGALDATLRVWAQDLPPKYGCTVNMVAPGPVLTDTFREHFTEEEWLNVKDLLSKEVPVEGFGASVEDVSWAVAFLAEERSKFINGEYLVVSGGSTMT